MTILSVNIDLDEKLDLYVQEQADMRGITRSLLATRIVEMVLMDRAVLAVLDDEVGKPTFGVAANVRSVAVSKPRELRPQIQHLPQPGRKVEKRNGKMTKTEMREMLAEAVVNTGGRRISLRDRKELIIGKIQARGRICWTDLGEDQDSRQRFQGAMRELLDEGRIYKNKAEPITRIVYYQLTPSAEAAVTSSPAASGPTSVPPETSKDQVSAPAERSAGADVVVDVPMFLSWQRDITLMSELKDTEYPDVKEAHIALVDGNS